MRLARLLAIATSTALVACSTSSGSAAPGSGAMPDASVEDGAIPEAGPDGCRSPLPDGGPTLAQLTSPQACQQLQGEILQRAPACDGTVLFLEVEGDCTAFWVFDATSGALLEAGGECNTGPEACTSATGFDYPARCWPSEAGAWTTLCPPGGADAASDATGEATADAPME